MWSAVVRLTATRRMKTGVGPLAGNVYFLHSETTPKDFVFTLALVLVQLTCGHIAKTQKKSRAIFLNFHHPGRGTFGHQHPKRLGRKFWNDFFRRPYQTRSTQMLCFRLFTLVPDLIRRPQKNIILGWNDLGSLGLRGISQTLNITATNPESSVYILFRFISQKHYF